MSKVWITGVAGFLGSHLADALLAAGHDVGGNDNLAQGDRKNVPRDVEFHLLDCNDRDHLATAMFGYSHLVHAAAAPYEGLSFFSPHYITTNIVNASVGAFSAAIAAGVERIVNLSSMARYGDGPAPFTERQNPRPVDPYGIGKVAVESFGRNLCSVHEVEFVVAVPGNIIGPRQRYDDPFRGVTSIFINLALQNKPLPIYGDGWQQRLFTPYDWVVEALVKMCFQPGIHNEVFNIGPDDDPIAVNTLAEMVWLACGHNESTAKKRYLPNRVGDVKLAYSSSDKVRRGLHLNGGMSLHQCIGKMVSDVMQRGVKPFRYDLPIEIFNHKTPAVWTERTL